MTEHKHTVEQWIRDGGDGLMVYALRAKPGGRPLMVNAFSARVQNDNHIATPEELEANAQLMVTAPRMLDVLERAARLFGGHTGAPGDPVNAIEREQRANILDAIHEVIREATGR